MAERKRMTTATVDPAARAKFEEEFRRQGRPNPRPGPQSPGKQPSMWLQIMSTLDNAFTNLQRSLMGGRLTGDTNVGSGYGGRERAYAMDDKVTEMQTGVKTKPNTY